MEIFWNTIAQYNEATWWTQLLITAAGILLTTQLYRKPTLWAKRSMKIYMVFLNGWISIVYYMMYCGARGHHHILAIWWGYSMQCLSSTRSFRGHAEWNFP